MSGYLPGGESDLIVTKRFFRNLKSYIGNIIGEIIRQPIYKKEFHIMGLRLFSSKCETVFTFEGKGFTFIKGEDFFTSTNPYIFSIYNGDQMVGNIKVSNITDEDIFSSKHEEFFTFKGLQVFRYSSMYIKENKLHRNFYRIKCQKSFNSKGQDIFAIKGEDLFDISGYDTIHIKNLLKKNYQVEIDEF